MSICRIAGIVIEHGKDRNYALEDCAYYRIFRV